ncbi:tRNA (N(6)-L-threonylcarbamoyladenosine(37)-C(2))-methylthiotransferase MtaB [bacterium]|nr:tRNA (N(6)-L-threonylcarbamoyladenosine(37)-C(2))-methylthiotransferase MtaB [bacterium]
MRLQAYRIVTLGCKLNQFESTMMGELLDQAGLHACRADEKADLVVVNSCTVTLKTDRESKQAVRRAKRDSPDSVIVVTGCLAQRYPDEFAVMSEVDYILGNEEKVRLATLIMELKQQKQPKRIQVSDISLSTKIANTVLRRFSSYTRAFIKVQDGCNCSCTYCAVRFARGPSRSLPLDRVLTQFRVFIEHGYREVVLTGINLGIYGRDLLPQCSLADLVLELTRISPTTRIRLSSVEPHEWDESLFRIIETCPGLCGHFHIPLQSGSDSVLGRMDRKYSRRDFEALVNRLARMRPDACLGADVIAGFPGEDETEFRTTLELIESLPLAYLHVFGYSVRKGTPASTFSKPCDRELISARVAELRAVGARKRQMFYENQKGRIKEVLVLGKRDHRTGLLVGLTDNYLKVLFEGDESLFNTITRVTLEEIKDRGFMGQII